MSKCKDENCTRDIFEKPGHAQGYCKSCYDRLRKAGKLQLREVAAKGYYDGVVCQVDGCEETSRYKGLCKKHYKRAWRHGNPNVTMLNMSGGTCEVEGCDRPRKSSDGYCAMHWTRVYRHNREHRVKGEDGSGVINAGGYRVHTVNGEKKYEHILLAENALGKPLPDKAVVHHMNEKPADNHTLLNLVTCPNQAYHLLLHRRMKAADFARKMKWNVAEFLATVTQELPT